LHDAENFDEHLRDGVEDNLIKTLDITVEWEEGPVERDQPITTLIDTLWVYIHWPAILGQAESSIPECFERVI
jgi:hypothetical protein